ncbi:MAG: DivIVA domain-containing protein [Clostridia bacterium]|nr:DivIVA domain-containing protein [Clostridia bacterium]
MHNGEYIRTVKFDKAMRGYNVEDVDTFLDEVAEDVDKLIEQNRALSERLAQATKQLQSNSEATTVAAPVIDNSGSIEQVQSILVSAQRFSDQIINEANEKAASILNEANTKAKEIDEKVGAVLTAFEKDIAERKANADAQVNKMLSDAAIKSEGIITAAHDSVARQQLLFDKLKVEVSEFKKKLFDNHKQQLEVLQKFPDSVPYDPERAAKAVEFVADSEPEFRDFLPDVPSDISSTSKEEENLEQTEQPVEQVEAAEEVQAELTFVGEEEGAEV